MGEHADIGFFVLVTDHPHYYDRRHQAHSARTADFSLRPDHQYEAGRRLVYRTDKLHGPDIVLRGNYRFNWRNLGHRWKALVLKVQ